MPPSSTNTRVLAALAAAQRHWRCCCRDSRPPAAANDIGQRQGSQIGERQQRVCRPCITWRHSCKHGSHPPLCAATVLVEAAANVCMHTAIPDTHAMHEEYNDDTPAVLATRAEKYAPCAPGTSPRARQQTAFHANNKPHNCRGNFPDLLRKCLALSCVHDDLEISWLAAACM